MDTSGKMQDLSIKWISAVYHIRSADWRRDVFACRDHDGLVLCLDGSIEYDFHGSTAVAKAGDAVILPGNLPYSGTKLSAGDVEFIVVDFDCRYADEYERLGLPAVVPLGAHGGIRQKFRDILSTWNEHRLNMPIRVRELLYSLLGDLSDLCAPAVSNVTQDVIAYIHENLSDPTLRLSALCERFFISESQLRRNFLKATGQTPNEYITARRMERAMNELSYPGRTVKAVSEICGFASPYYFSLCFSRATGMSPTEYREKHRV